MEQQPRILFGDRTVDFGLQCKELLEKSGFQVTIAENDGIEIQKYIYLIYPDVIIMRVSPPHMDALAMMEFCRCLKEYHPYFILFGLEEKESIEPKIFDWKEIVYFQMPFDLNFFCEEISATTEKQIQIPFYMYLNLEEFVTNELERMRFPRRLRGYHCVKEALMMGIADSSRLELITKVLYPELAEKYDTSKKNIEKLICRSIEKYWLEGDPDVMREYFGPLVKDKKPPTTSPFLKIVSQKIRLKLEKYKKIGS